MIIMIISDEDIPWVLLAPAISVAHAPTSVKNICNETSLVFYATTKLFVSLLPLIIYIKIKIND